jgi:hypothetical protein
MYNRTTRIPSIQELLEYDMIQVTFSLEQVKELDFKLVDRLFRKLGRCGKDVRGKLMLLFPYNDPLQEIFEIEEVRNFVQQLFIKHNNLFYFLTHKFGYNGSILACLCNIKVNKPITGAKFFEDVPVQFEIPIQLKEDIINGVIDYGLQVGDSLETIQSFLRKFPELCE